MPFIVNASKILGGLVGAALLGLVVDYLAVSLLRGMGNRHGNAVETAIVKNLQGASRFALPLIAVKSVLPFLAVPAAAASLLQHVLSILLIIAIAWLVVSLTFVLDDLVLTRYSLSATDNLRARRAHTQVEVFRKVTVFVVAVIAIAAILMTFSQVRAVGASILASAGVLGIIAGIAAQSSLANLFAGVQIAIAQPIRIDDVVVVNGHWGRVEEIKLTYVVVKIWDLRRLVLPISYFSQNPFENWTKTSANLIGTVYLYVDYSVPVQAVRDELERIVKSTPRFDGQVWVLQVTSVTEMSIELRALVSAVDSSTLWDLRCEVRERLVDFVQKNFPEALPRLRTRLDGPPAGPGPAPQEPAGGRLPSPPWG